MRYLLYRSSVVPLWYHRLNTLAHPLSGDCRALPRGGMRVHDATGHSSQSLMVSPRNPSDEWIALDGADGVDRATPLSPSVSIPMEETMVPGPVNGAAIKRSTAWILQGSPVPDGCNVTWKTSWGMELDNVTIRVLETLSRISSLGYANILNTSIPTSHWLGLEFASTMSVLFTSMPIVAVSVKKLCVRLEPPQPLTPPPVFTLNLDSMR